MDNDILQKGVANTHTPSLDIIFNGSNHYTIHLNVGIPESEISEGIDNLVDMITKRDNMKIGWNKITGQKISQTSLNNEIIWLDHDNEIIQTGPPNKRYCRAKVSPNDSPT